jgi:hypothetical protein
MKRILYLLPLLLGIFAWGTQSSPTQDVSRIVNATLTAIAQNNPQVVTPQATFTPIPIQAQPTVTHVAPTILPSLSPSMGTITGNLSFPSSFIPPMRVVFFNLTDGSVSYTDTGMNQGTYSMDLPAGNYHVVAYPYSGEAPAAGSPIAGGAGGYTKMVPCGLSADCTDHSLIPITVTVGQTTMINPGDWYAPEGTFPPMPSNQ